MFSWKPMYQELAGKLLEYRDRQDVLLAWLAEMKEQSIPVIKLDDENPKGTSIPLTEIDPFSFYANFNRAIKTEHRIHCLEFIKEKMRLSSPVPSDFAGLPTVNLLNAIFFPFAYDREPHMVSTLWDLAEQVVTRSPSDVDEALFTNCLRIPQIGMSKLTTGMFWMRPDQYLAIDSLTIDYVKEKGINLENLKSYGNYRTAIAKVESGLGTDFPQISRDAYMSANTIPVTNEVLDAGLTKLLEAQAEASGISVEEVVSQLTEMPNEGQKENEITNRLRVMPLLADVLSTHPVDVPRLKSIAKELWVLGNRTDSMHRNAFLSSDIAVEAIDNLLDEIGGVDDLARIDGFVDVATENGYASPKGAVNASGAAQFASALLSAVYPDRFVDFRGNRWNELFLQITGSKKRLCTGSSYGWKLIRAGKFVTALTATETFKEHFGEEHGTWKMAGLAWCFRKGLNEKEEPAVEDDSNIQVREKIIPAELPAEVAYWWLNAKPKVWDFRNLPVGSRETYTSHGENGNKRRIFKCFSEIKPGDLIVGYVTSPDKEIVAICEVTKALYGEPGQEQFEFKKIKQFAKTVTWDELKSFLELKNCEPLINNQGSLFSLREEEYELISGLLDERNPEPQIESVKPYTRANALQDLFMPPKSLDSILSRLKRKKALILQGPPGVGKTFVARRLAYTLMGKKDDDRVQMVQFHPSYGYEDFVEGYRPTAAGGLARREGVFCRFAREARNDPGRDWFFIIDEINRGNLAKIFGELLMLIEADKRGPDNAIPLTYSETGETFQFPENLYIIGTMNTADRSLAMVDYALRRRFAFMTLNPEFGSIEFSSWLKKCGVSDEIISKIRTRIATLNQEIEKERDLGSRFLIGHSFFCPDENTFPNEEWYKEIVDGEIRPLLEEYFDDTSKVEKLITDLLS